MLLAKVVDFQCFLQKTGGCSGFYVGLLPTSTLSLMIF